MKNLDTLSKRILVIAISISIVALSLSALMLSAGYAFASNNSDAMELGTDMPETTYDDTMSIRVIFQIIFWIIIPENVSSSHTPQNSSMPLSAL